MLLSSESLSDMGKWVPGSGESYMETWRSILLIQQVVMYLIAQGTVWKM